MAAFADFWATYSTLVYSVGIHALLALWCFEVFSRKLLFYIRQHQINNKLAR